MTGKILFLSALCLSAMTVKASDVNMASDSIVKQQPTGVKIGSLK